MKYRLFDISISSNRELPGLQPCETEVPDFTVEFCSGSGPDLTEFEWINDWKSRLGETVMTCSKKNEDYHLHFPNTTDFLIQLKQKKIQVFQPFAKVDRVESAAQLLQDQVLPRVLTHTGRLVLHSSAVVRRDGSAIAFFGDTGRGKSTLAASFYQAGYGLVTDDCLLLEKKGHGLQGVPVGNGLRLWPDSAEEMKIATGEPPLRHHGTEKLRIALDRQQESGCPVDLVACFLLGEPNSKQQNDEILIGQVRGRPVMMALVEAAFVLDLVSPNVVKDNFNLVGEIARSNIPVFSLDFPRRFSELARVRKRIESLVDSL